MRRRMRLTWRVVASRRKSGPKRAAAMAGQRRAE
jgi:hypothetical protein